MVSSLKKNKNKSDCCSPSGLNQPQKVLQVCTLQTQSVFLKVTSVQFLLTRPQRSVSPCCPPVARSLYCRLMKASLQLVGAAVQLDLEGLEVRPVVRLGAPTLQHDLVEEVGTFGRSWHPVTFSNLLEHFLVAESCGEQVERGNMSG